MAVRQKDHCHLTKSDYEISEVDKTYKHYYSPTLKPYKIFLLILLKEEGVTPR